jgi:hypothetical protein
MTTAYHFEQVHSDAVSDIIHGHTGAGGTTRGGRMTV